MQIVMTSDETQIHIFANWPMLHAKRVTRDNRKNPEYRVASAIRKLRTDTNCPAGKSWPNHVKNEQHIGSEKTYGPKNTEQWNIMMQRTASENAACLRRIFKIYYRLRLILSVCWQPNAKGRYGVGRVTPSASSLDTVDHSILLSRL